MKKPHKPAIPVNELPEGIRLSIVNCRRLWNDAKRLYDSKSYASAILLLILAKEEFAKALLLLKHEKNSQEVNELEVKQYFGFHDVRLEEFGKFYNESLGMNLSEQFSSIMLFDVDTRERYTYVDWGQLGWSFPEYKTPKDWKIERGLFDKFRVESFMSDLQQVFWKLEKDQYFQKVISKLPVDRPTGDKLLDIIKDVTKLGNPTTNTEIKQTKIKIIIEVEDTSKKREWEIEIKQKIFKRFSSYKLDVIIKKKTKV